LYFPVLLLLAAQGATGESSAISLPRAELRLVVEIVQAASQAPASFLHDLDPVLISELTRRGCFGGVVPAPGALPGPRDLALRVAFDEFEDEISFDQSIAERSAADRPPDLQRREVAFVRTGFTVELRLPGAEDAIVRSAHYRRQALHHPVHDEDPHEQAIAHLATTVARTVRSFSCEGSEKRFRQERAKAAAR
jgi:hypothetical protein